MHARTESHDTLMHSGSPADVSPAAHTPCAYIVATPVAPPHVGPSASKQTHTSHPSATTLGSSCGASAALMPMCTPSPRTLPQQQTSCCVLPPPSQREHTHVHPGSPPGTLTPDCRDPSLLLNALLLLPPAMPPTPPPALLAPLMLPLLPRAALSTCSCWPSWLSLLLEAAWWFWTSLNMALMLLCFSAITCCILGVHVCGVGMCSEQRHKQKHDESVRPGCRNASTSQTDCHDASRQLAAGAYSCVPVHNNPLATQTRTRKHKPAHPSSLLLP